MPTSDRGTEAKSVPPHPFRVGDRVRRRLVPEFTYTVKRVPTNPDDVWITLATDLGGESFSRRDELEFEPGANAVRPDVVLANVEYQPDRVKWAEALERVLSAPSPMDVDDVRRTARLVVEKRVHCVSDEAIEALARRVLELEAGLEAALAGAALLEPNK